MKQNVIHKQYRRNISNSVLISLFSILFEDFDRFFQLQVDEDGMACPICEKTFTFVIVCSTREEATKTNDVPENKVSL